MQRMEIGIGGIERHFAAGGNAEAITAFRQVAPGGGFDILRRPLQHDRDRVEVAIERTAGRAASALRISTIQSTSMISAPWTDLRQQVGGIPADMQLDFRPSRVDRGDECCSNGRITSRYVSGLTSEAAASPTPTISAPASICAWAQRIACAVSTLKTLPRMPAPRKNPDSVCVQPRTSAISAIGPSRPPSIG